MGKRHVGKKRGEMEMAHEKIWEFSKKRRQMGSRIERTGVKGEVKVTGE